MSKTPAQLIEAAALKAGSLSALGNAVGREERTLYRIGNGTHPLAAKLRERLETYLAEPAAKYVSGKETLRTPELSNVEPHPIRLTRKIRVYSMIQAGLATVYETTPVSWEDVVDYDGGDATAFALRVTGDSMLPRFSSGTVIIVSPQYPPRYGDFVAACIHDEGALFKKFSHSGDAKTVRLASLNPEFPPVELPRESFDWIYKVVEARDKNL